MTTYEYQVMELNRIIKEWASNKSYKKDVAEFEESYKDNYSRLARDLDFMVDGSFGAGVCFRLQQVYYWAKGHKRVNYKAGIGQVFINALFQGEFRHWKDLSESLQNDINKLVEDFFNDPDIEFNMTLLPELGGPEA